MKRPDVALRNYKHGQSGGGIRPTPEYNAYRHAKARCNNPRNPKWRLYGARGIKFLFPNFTTFLKEVGTKPTPKHVLDREDNNGNYTSGNVRWVTQSISIKNRRKFSEC